MTWALGLASLALGVAYTGLGVLTVDELRRDTRTRGFSQFGAAFALMAFTCGPHHLFDGYHVLAGEYPASPLVAVAVLVGLPAGWVVVSLRIEVLFGGRGERVIAGTPGWLVACPLLFAGIAGALVALSAAGPGVAEHPVSILSLASLALVVCYVMVGWFLLRTQVRRHRELGLWSLSGLALGAVFPTCALMHLTFSLEHAGDVHMAALDAVGVPAAIYFLIVVHRIYRQSLVDWNRRPLVGVAGEPARPSPWS